MTKAFRNYGWAAFFILPSLVPLLFFTVGPALGALAVSFMRWDLLTPAKWIGLDNYRTLVADETFRAAALHTLEFVAGYLPLVVIGGLAVALLLNRNMPESGFLRTLYFMPVVTSWVAVALIWRWLLNPEYGVVNAVLRSLHLPTPGWWVDVHWAMPSVILASAWKDIGYTMLILLAGLQAIPREYYESAAIDGANAWHQFRRITLPLLTPQILIVLVISIINNVQVFEQVWVMTDGGPEGATSTVVEQIVRNSFAYGRMGYASAQSVFLFAATLLITWGQLRMQKRWVHYEA
jgi:multiple sugar transport system permease protein